MSKPRYREIYDLLKERIQQGIYITGDYLPSEHELCDTHSITRTTVRKALDELVQTGYIEKQHGKGSRVIERNRSLGLLNVKGFSEAVDGDVNTIFLQEPDERDWSSQIMMPVRNEELRAPCIHFERLRCVGSEPVMLENNWFPATVLQGFTDIDFVKQSFFKTLSRHYLIEIKGSRQELRAENANKKTAYLLQIEELTPVLHISIMFETSSPDLTIYSELYCNTQSYPIGNQYHL